MKKGTKITPIILAGGSGTRLWPMSRKSYPKQFSKILEPQSLFQQSVLRLSNSSVFEFSNLIIITNNDFRFIVSDQLAEIGVENASILLEPSGKNTAPAILAASMFSNEERKENNTVLVSPADHLMTDYHQFHKMVEEGRKVAKKGNFVTFGVHPTRPETGYGYLKVKRHASSHSSKVEKFVEKPSVEIAKAMLSSGDYLWNSGIFLFNPSELEHAFKILEPKIFKGVTSAVNKRNYDLNFLRLDKQSWEECESISIDYAIMEKVNNIYAVTLESGWNDLGNWKTVSEQFDSDEFGVVKLGNTTAIDCQNVFLKSEKNSLALVALGVENLIAVAMEDAILISDINSVQKVGKVVQTLKKESKEQASNFPTEYRPWGWFDVLTNGIGFKVKKIVVNSGASLSLQKHRFRSEHWVVVQGTASVRVEENETELHEGESIYVPKEAIHRISNFCKKQLVIIEVQTGSYLGEDDIIRLEDIYSRE